MARKTMWAVAGALLAFAPLASAASYGLIVQNARTYASEVISSGDVEIDYRGASPLARVVIGMSDAEATAIDLDDVISVTFTLANAKFARRVRDGDLQPSMMGTSIGCSARVRDTDDGEAGESTVTFEIEASDATCTCSSCDASAQFDFTLPRLEGLNKKDVTMTVSTDRPGGSGWMSTEATTSVADIPCAGADADAYCRTLENGIVRSFRPNRDGETGLRRQRPVVEFAEGLTFTANSGGSTSIDLTAARRAFVPHPWGIGRAAVLGDVTVGVTSAAACTGADPTPRFCYLQSNGRPFSIGRSGEGRGDLLVNVSGDFRSGDRVFLDLDGSWTPGAGESLTLVNGSMEGAFNVLNAAGNANAGDGDAAEMNREEGVTTRRLIYWPNGNDPLRPGGYRSSFAVNFTSGSVTDKGARPASSEANTFMTQYSVVEDDQVAYAIPPGTTGDVGNVRIKCEVATQCTVYLECDHADGRSWFAQVDDPIAGRSTLVLTSEGIRTALGMADGDWTRGRMSCSVYSTREISLQVLTRSSTGVLVNNTYVDD